MTDLINTSIPELATGKNGTVHIDQVIEILATRKVYTSATMPDPTTVAGAIVSVTDGAAGQPCLAYSDGTAFHRILLGAAPSATA